MTSSGITEDEEKYPKEFGKKIHPPKAIEKMREMDRGDDWQHKFAVTKIVETRESDLITPRTTHD